MYQEKIITKHQTFNSEDQLGKLREEKLNEGSQAITNIVWYQKKQYLIQVPTYLSYTPNSVP